MTIVDFINKHDPNQNNNEGPKWNKFCRCIIMPDGEVFECEDNLEETLIKIICDKYNSMYLNISRDIILKGIDLCCHVDYFVDMLDCVVASNYDSGIMSEDSLNFAFSGFVTASLSKYAFIKPLSWFNYTVVKENASIEKIIHNYINKYCSK